MVEQPSADDLVVLQGQLTAHRVLFAFVFASRFRANLDPEGAARATFDALMGMLGAADHAQSVPSDRERAAAMLNEAAHVELSEMLDEVLEVLKKLRS